MPVWRNSVFVTSCWRLLRSSALLLRFLLHFVGNADVGERIDRKPSNWFSGVNLDPAPRSFEPIRRTTIGAKDRESRSIQRGAKIPCCSQDTLVYFILGFSACVEPAPGDRQRMVASFSTISSHRYAPQLRQGARGDLEGVTAARLSANRFQPVRRAPWQGAFSPCGSSIEALGCAESDIPGPAHAILPSTVCRWASASTPSVLCPEFRRGLASRPAP